MTATYTNQPGTRNVDTVRHLINDKNVTTEADALLTDEEIQFHIDSEPHIYIAAAEAATAIATTFAASETVKQVGDLRREFGDGGRAATYHATATRLRGNAYNKATPYAGGLLESEKRTGDQDTDRVDPAFTRDQMDNPSGDSEDFYKDN